MKIIGAGFARTGTLSLKHALQKLGYAPCYHMDEVFKNPDHMAKWRDLAEGQPVDWEAFLGEYQAGVDFPVSIFYEELFTQYPDARVILTTRDPDRWYSSALETIYTMSHSVPWYVKYILPRVARFEEMVRYVVWQKYFNGRFTDKQYAIEKFKKHNETVKQTIPPEKLLVFQVKDGWEPLCTFLEVPVPDVPFPNINDKKSMQRRVQVMKGLALLLPLLGIGLAFLIGYLLLRR